MFEGYFSLKLPTNIQTVAHRKLLQLNIADKLDDLRIPHVNRLEGLRGNMRGQYSIRINKQWLRLASSGNVTEPTKSKSSITIKHEDFNETNFPLHTR